jgi:hypothetical protein
MDAGSRLSRNVIVVVCLALGALLFWVGQTTWSWAGGLKGHPRSVESLDLGYYQVIWSNPKLALVKSADEGELFLELSSEAAKALPAKSTTPAFLVVREDDGKRVYEWASPEAPPTIEPPPAATDSPRS